MSKRTFRKFQHHLSEIQRLTARNFYRGHEYVPAYIWTDCLANLSRVYDKLIRAEQLKEEVEYTIWKNDNYNAVNIAMSRLGQ